MKKSIFVLFICCLTFLSDSFAFNLRKTTLDNAGNVINSIFQDSRGLIWIGTNTGISSYNGKSITLLNGYKGIKHIYGTSTGQIFAETLYGLKVLDTQSDSVTTFDMFNNISFSAIDRKNTSFIIQGNGSVYYRICMQKSYDNIIIPELTASSIKMFFIDSKNVLRIITKEGTLRNFDILYNNDNIYLNEKPTVKIAPNILFCFVNNNRIFIINEEYEFSEVDLITHETIYITNLKPLLADKGDITAGIIFKNNFYLGTETGFFVIKDNSVVKIPVKAGVKRLIKDKYQDLIWIGTSGDGLYTYSYDPYTINSHLLADFYPSASRPVTTTCLDDEGTLWIGSEGDGILLLADYDPDKEIKVTRSLTHKNGLPGNTVYCLYKSPQGVWIGCKSGLAFYSYKYKKVVIPDNIPFNHIHSVCVQNSLLWLSAHGKGIVKANLIYKDEIPEIQATELYSISNNDEALNRFSSIYADNRNLLCINKGNGIFKVTHNGLEKLIFQDNRINATNQLIALNDSDYMAATDFGVFQFTLDNQKVSNEKLLSDIATKDITGYIRDDYWLSTDNGLMLYNTKLNTFRYFDISYELTGIQYGDGASCKDDCNGILFWGGIKGFTTVRYNEYDEAMDYMPALYLEEISLFGINRHMNDFKNDDSNKLVFNADENFISLTFNALDYTNGNNYIYYYKIGDGQWVNNGNSGMISFTDISPGNYELYIKYYNTMFNKESYAQKIALVILPPWYQSAYAYIIYMLSGILIVFLITYLIVKRRKKRKLEEAVKAEQRRKEEIYEAKLDFFTDIAHEFCTPLTLITGPCNLILNQKNINPSTLKYAGVINRNAKRMNSLINDLMSFKQMESGYKLPEIVKLNISEVTDQVIDAFKINVTGSNILIRKQYFAGISWNTDEKFFTTILINLISNAVKHTNEESVLVELYTENTSLILKVTNRGKGIPREDIENIFNRFSVLPHENQNGWKQTGLGLTITASMVKLLSGNIEVDSIPDESTTFCVTLPYLDTATIKEVGNHNLNEIMIPEYSLPPIEYKYKEDRPTVTVIEDDPEMLWFICDILCSEFNVLPVNNPSDAIETILKNHTDIILCDIMMESIDGIELSKSLKANKSISHIPLIIVSAIHDIEIQTKALNAGAELYVTKPFDATYLKTTIRRLLGRKEDLKDYFASPLSAYELNMGKLQHSEHRKFLKKVYAIISKNVQNEHLSPDFIASELGMSLRTLYRKLKEATDKGLLEIIKDGKLAVAENLLLKSKFTIDEIVFKSGFSNRASFYRAFSKKYGCTPSEFVNKNNKSYESVVKGFTDSPVVK